MPGANLAGALIRAASLQDCGEPGALQQPEPACPARLQVCPRCAHCALGGRPGLSCLCCSVLWDMLPRDEDSSPPPHRGAAASVGRWMLGSGWLGRTATLGHPRLHM